MIGLSGMWANGFNSSAVAVGSMRPGRFPPSVARGKLAGSVGSVTDAFASGYFQPLVARSHDRKRSDATAQACQDMAAIYYYVAGHPFRQPGGKSALTKKEADQLATFGRVSTREEDTAAQQNFLLEEWHVEDESALGIKIMRRAGGNAATRYTHAQLIGLRILMGVGALPRIAARLQSAGLGADTPAAVIYRGTTEAEETVVGTLGDIAGRAARLQAPAVIVIGEVVAFRSLLARPPGRLEPDAGATADHDHGLPGQLQLSQGRGTGWCGGHGSSRHAARNNSVNVEVSIVDL
jgi:hypothetical protein